MTKLRKQRMKKKFRANVNRKRLRNKQSNKGKVKCDEIKKEWRYSKTTQQNLECMGLVYDPNKDLKRSNTKKELVSKIASTTRWNTTDNKKFIPYKKHVAELLEKEANAPRERSFQLPASQVEWVTYLMDKYGKDYKAMVRDKRNHYQETWKQIRAKIKLFMGIPEQYAKYLESRGLGIDNSIDDDNASTTSSDGSVI